MWHVWYTSEDRIGGDGIYRLPSNSPNSLNSIKSHFKRMVQLKIELSDELNRKLARFMADKDISMRDKNIVISRAVDVYLEYPEAEDNGLDDLIKSATERRKTAQREGMKKRWAEKEKAARKASP